MILGVGELEADVAEAEIPPALLGAREKGRRDVGADDAPGRSDALCKREARTPGAAADVEHALAVARRRLPRTSAAVASPADRVEVGLEHDPGLPGLRVPELGLLPVGDHVCGQAAAGPSPCGIAGPPEETPTWAGRSRRSPMVKPTLITWMMSPALVPGTGASNIAWCSLGSKRSPGCGLDLEDPVLLEGGEQVALGQLDALDQPGRGGAHRVGDGVERAVEVVVDRQQVAGEAGRAVELGVAAVALGALADVLDVGERPQQPVLEVGDLGAERRRLVGRRRPRR